MPSKPNPWKYTLETNPKSKHKHLWLLAIPNKNPTFEIQIQTQTQISKHIDQKEGALNRKIKKKKTEEEEKTTTFGHGGWRWSCGASA